MRKIKRNDRRSVHRWFRFKDVPVFKMSGRTRFLNPAVIKIAGLCAQQVGLNNHVVYEEYEHPKLGLCARGEVNNHMGL